MTSQQTLFRFYRSNLATVVWDPKQGHALAEFVKGQFYTEDKKVAEKLIELGYPQVPLDAETPPQILFEKGKSLEYGEHKEVMPRGVTEEVALRREKQKAEQAALAEKAKKMSKKNGGGKADTSVNTTAGDGAGDEDNENISPASLVQKARVQASQAVRTKRKIKRRAK